MIDFPRNKRQWILQELKTQKHDKNYAEPFFHTYKNKLKVVKNVLFWKMKKGFFGWLIRLQFQVVLPKAPFFYGEKELPAGRFFHLKNRHLSATSLPSPSGHIVTKTSKQMR